MCIRDRSAYVEKDVYVKKNKTFERVVVRDVGNVEIMLALGLGDRIVMACLDTQEVDYLKKRYPGEFEKINKIVSARINTEQVLWAKPDLIFARESTFTTNMLKSASWWEKRGVTCYIPDTSTIKLPQTIQGELNYIREVGALFGRKEMSEKIVSDTEKYIDYVRNISIHQKPERVLALEGVPGRYVVTYDSKWLVNDYILKLGGIPATERRGFGAENLMEINPDVIFVEYFDDVTKSFAEELRMNPKYSSLQAVQKNRIYLLPVELVFMPGIRVGEGVECVAKGLYPDLLGEK